MIHGLSARADAEAFTGEGAGEVLSGVRPAYVKPYVKRHNNDATDAEAICEAVTRPNMRFVATTIGWDD